jgi:signal transduction histidine kinase
MANYAAISIENARLYHSVIAERDRVIKAQHEASSKLQRDLHDGPTQLVAAMQMNIEFCKTALKKNVSLVEPELEQMNVLAQKALHQMRTMLFELRPLELETEGLGAALKTFMDRRQKTEKTRLLLDVQSDQPDNKISRLDSKYERALFAMVQETVNNALKHAKANHIFVKVYERNDQLSITILDDGLGFELRTITENYESRGSYGMINLKERADLVGGVLVIKSAPGAGAEFKVTTTLTSEMKQKPG